MVRLGFLWEQSSGPVQVSLSGGTTPAPGFTPNQVGVYVFRLVVKNNAERASAPDFTEVRVGNAQGGCGCGPVGAGGGWMVVALGAFGLLAIRRRVR